MTTKTIIISAPDNSHSGRGILTLSMENELLTCKMRLYNFQPLNRYCKLGVFHENEVFSANLIERSGVYYTSLVGDFDLQKDFYCAIIDTSLNNQALLAGGTYGGFYFENSPFQAVDSVESEPNEKAKTDESEVVECGEHPDCAKCKYREVFYQTEQENDTPPKSNEKLDTIPSLIDSILPQLDYIFKNFPANDELSALVENSKFVKMSDGDYSIGAIYDSQSQLKYICYAVRANYNATAPEELGEHYQWVPIDKSDPLSDGYYIVFQDASDLKIIEV